MSTPEEIKKWLTSCSDKSNCTYCDNIWICEQKAEVLAYIWRLEAELEIVKQERDAAQTDMEAIARQTTDNFVCTYCGVKTLEECGECQMRNESFKWRGLQEGEQ